jgi:hypothetical protein
MAPPSVHRPLHARPRDLAGHPAPLETPQLPHEPAPGPPVQPRAVREDPETHERHPDADRKDPRLAGMKLQPTPFFKPRGDRSLRARQFMLVVAEQGKIIHVAQVPTPPQIFLNEVVEPVEIEVREKLARQVADRNASGPPHGKEVVVAAGPVLLGTALVTRQDRPETSQQRPVTEPPVKWWFRRFWPPDPKESSHPFRLIPAT